MASLKERVLGVLVASKVLTPQQIEDATKVQRQTGGSLQKILIEQGFIKESDLLSATSQGLGIPLISLARMKLDPALRRLIPRAVAQQHQLLPLACIGQTLTVVMADPLNVFAMDTVTSMTGLTLNPMLASSKDVQDAIEQYYGAETSETLEAIVKESADDSSLELLSDKAEQADEGNLLKLTQELPVVRLTDAILTKTINLRASDLLIEPMETRLRIRYRVDGVFQEGESPPKQYQQGIVSRIKIMSELNIAERRIPQDGHFNFQVNDRVVDFRVSTLPTHHGEKACLRLLDKTQIKLDLGTMGFAAEDLERIKKASERPHGMVLTTGPTGSGKTTTLYALLKHIDRPDKNLVTVEDPVEYQLRGINQVNVRTDIGLTFSSSLRSILRQDPDVIMVGEIRDTETADMAVKAALTGHLVLSTLHTNSAIGTVVRLMNMGVEPFLLNSCLVCVIGQRLVRKICQRCSELYQPPKAMAEKLGLVDAKGEPLMVARGAGCQNCFKSGYRGREVIGEILMMTPVIRDLILRRAQEREIEDAARKEGMRSLRDHAIQKVKAKVTTLDEIFRTTVGELVEG